MTPIDRARAAFVAACRLDVTTRKPGNVSIASPGHGMQAAQFVASALAAAGPLFARGATVGERIERATAASWAAAGCNTNLGIVLLCAPLAAAVERSGKLTTEAVESVLAALDLDDARAAYRAIAAVEPGGLGAVEREDVHAAPSVTLRAAMALAAHRDSIARQYANGYADVFEAARLPQPPGFSLMAEPASPQTQAHVQRIWLHWLAREPDSHIVRKHGRALAHSVMTAAQAWRAVPQPDADPAFAAWDQALKQARVNPGSSADLTVATLLAAAWHGS